LSPSGLSIMVDIAVKGGAAWVCHAQGRHLTDVLLPLHVIHFNRKSFLRRVDPVLLEQTEEGSPCVLTLHCSLGSSIAIRRLLVVSEARTMEVYSQTGEYCGTVRVGLGWFVGFSVILCFCAPRLGPQLLSLAGRRSVSVCRVIVGLQQLQPSPVCSPGIDMQQVQCLVDEMGKSLSPGAQNLMDMVHFQQKNQTGSLGGFLPLLMGGGVFSALAQKSSISPGAIPIHTHHTQLAEMMSHFLKGQGRDQVLSSGGELLPVLQSVCGQVTKLRLDDAAETEKKMRNGMELDSAMEHRLEEMERRLKEHVDRRLDALEQKLESALLSVLPQLALNQGATSSSAGEPQKQICHD
uniref:Uncharacterized protein n=1 Tax=Mola mola TaxID=94237 RepID=A0A3Q3W3X1_MOLML